MVSLEDLEYDLAEIDENLIRSDISVVDQGDRHALRQQIWDAIYGETHGGDRKSAEYKEKNQNDIMSFSSHAAEAMGITPRSVQRLTKVGRLPDDIKDLAPIIHDGHRI